MMDLTEKTANINRHPWELSRSHCIIRQINNHTFTTIADIDAGDRFFTTKLLPFVTDTIYAVDTAYVDTNTKFDGIHCINSISELPELNDNSAIIMMDVLEHVSDDAVFLCVILDKLSSGGTLLITVPAMQFLFSDHDTFLHHYRRYSRKQLLTLLQKSGLIVEKCHYFFFSLFFIRLLTLRKKHIGGIGEWRFSEYHTITRIIRFVLNADFFFCALFARFRIYLPGLSLLAVCKKDAQC